MAFGDRKTPLKAKKGFKKKTLAEVRAKHAAKRHTIKPKPRKKLKAKKPKKPSLRLLKSKLWAECKRIVRERYGNTCYTCGYSPLEGANWQTGHGKAKGSLPLQYKFDLRNLRPQCRACNVYRNGETDIFISRLELEKEGLEFLKEACYFDEDWNTWRIRQDVKTYGGIEAVEFVQKKIEEYKAVEN